MKATVDPDTCIGCELCVSICPEVFFMNKDGIAVTKSEIINPDAEATCRQATSDCPVTAITLVE